MVVEKHIKFRRLIPIIWKRILKMTLLSALIVVPLVWFELDQFTIGMTTPLILGTAISIFLGFRTNSAYDRWFQGRAIFGELGSATRNMSLLLARVNERYVNHHTGKDSAAAAQIMPRMIRRSLAFLWIFNRQLKDMTPLDFDTVEDLLSKEEITDLKTAKNPSLKIMYTQSRDFRKVVAEGQLYEAEVFEYVAIQRDIARLHAQANGLKNTPFPTHYTYFTDLFVWLLVVLLSLSLPANENSGYYAIPLVVLIGWIFSMIEGIGDYMDYPWANNRNVVPMDFLSRQHEIGIRAYGLDESDLPPMIAAKDGALL